MLLQGRALLATAVAAAALPPPAPPLPPVPTRSHPSVQPDVLKLRKRVTAWPLEFTFKVSAMSGRRAWGSRGVSPWLARLPTVRHGTSFGCCLYGGDFVLERAPRLFTSTASPLICRQTITRQRANSRMG